MLAVSFVFGPVGIKQDQVPERQVEAPTYSTKDTDVPPF